MSDQAVHASCVALQGRAILLIGASGSGKSDLALRLIDRGWSLVADDYVALAVSGERLLASAPPRIAGRMEVRGVGLVDCAPIGNVPVCLVLWLDRTPQRLPEPESWSFEGLGVPALPVDPFEASAPIKVEHLLRLYGLLLE